jgi:chromosome partitioning protein
VRDLAHRGVGQLVETVRDVTRATNPRLRISGILPTLYDGRTAHARAVLADIQDRYDVPVLDPPIARSVRFAEAPAIGRSALATSSTLRGVEAYRVHARRMVEATSA